jgi:hypothetical protein
LKRICSPKITATHSNMRFSSGMNAVIERRERNSRWSRDPTLNDHGRPVAAHITERDVEILKLLARYRYLPADDIHAFVGGSLKNVANRLNLLSRKPNLHINRPYQQRQNANNNYRRLIYELDDRGIAILRERGLPHLPKTYHRNFAHELMVCRITASIELGARQNRAVRLITWQEIMASEKTPLATRQSATPGSVPVSFAVHDARYSTTVTADARPFGLERNSAATGRSLYSVPASKPIAARSPWTPPISIDHPSIRNLPPIAP